MVSAAESPQKATNRCRNPAHLPLCGRAEPRVAVTFRGREKHAFARAWRHLLGDALGAKELAMEFQDRTLKCVDCGGEFVFTAGEQLFFHDKQFRNEPKRCKSCKTKRVSVLGTAAPRSTRVKVETEAVCSQCGKETTVPFRPTQGRPIFCRECFRDKRHAASA